MEGDGLLGDVVARRELEGRLEGEDGVGGGRHCCCGCAGGGGGWGGLKGRRYDARSLLKERAASLEPVVRFAPRWPLPACRAGRTSQRRKAWPAVRCPWLTEIGAASACSAPTGKSRRAVQGSHGIQCGGPGSIQPCLQLTLCGWSASGAVCCRQAAARQLPSPLALHLKKSKWVDDGFWVLELRRRLPMPRTRCQHYPTSRHASRGIATRENLWLCSYALLCEARGSAPSRRDVICRRPQTARPAPARRARHGDGSRRVFGECASGWAECTFAASGAVEARHIANNAAHIAKASRRHHAAEITRRWKSHLPARDTCRYCTPRAAQPLASRPVGPEAFRDCRRYATVYMRERRTMSYKNWRDDGSMTKGATMTGSGTNRDNKQDTRSRASVCAGVCAYQGHGALTIPPNTSTVRAETGARLGLGFGVVTSSRCSGVGVDSSLYVSAAAQRGILTPDC